MQPFASLPTPPQQPLLPTTALARCRKCGGYEIDIRQPRPVPQMWCDHIGVVSYLRITTGTSTHTVHGTPLDGRVPCAAPSTISMSSDTTGMHHPDYTTNTCHTPWATDTRAQQHNSTVLSLSTPALSCVWTALMTTTHMSWCATLFSAPTAAPLKAPLYV